jgi:hypothetical protein
MGEVRLEEMVVVLVLEMVVLEERVLEERGQQERVLAVQEGVSLVYYQQLSIKMKLIFVSRHLQKPSFK